MAGVPVAGLNVGASFEPSFVFDRSEAIKRRDGIGLCVDRLH